MQFSEGVRPPSKAVVLSPGIPVLPSKPTTSVEVSHRSLPVRKSQTRAAVVCGFLIYAARHRRRRGARSVRCALEPGKSSPDRIRNFSIIAHIDHGKSTLADRFLEMTGTIDKKDMQAQVLDGMDIERERGITIKLNTARLNVNEDGEDYVLNLIDTPGHVDFSYEVSRSLQACEGALLVVDATQGVQAQTLANVTLAMEADLEIIPVLNKVDLDSAEPDKVAAEIEDVIGIDCTDALQCSAKTGMGVAEIIKAVVARVPPPRDERENTLRALIFDSFYDSYQGVVCMFRIVAGRVCKKDKIRFYNSGKEYEVSELGIMIGGIRKPVDSLAAGEVGYVCAAIKTVDDARVGDTIILAGMENKVEPLPGYTEATPMVFCGLFPEESGQFESLKTAFERLALNDASLSYQVENSAALGLGFRCGFLGVLHMEVVKDRLEREFGIDLIVTAPSVEYRLLMNDDTEKVIQFANLLPDPTKIKEILEPYVRIDLILPEDCMGPCMDLAVKRRAIYKSTSFLTNSRVLLQYDMPMAEMIRDFFTELKARSRGYASMDYQNLDYRPGDLVKLEIDINKTSAAPLAQIVHRGRAREYGARICEILRQQIPAQQLKITIQARMGTTVVANEKISALRKDVLAKCYGGDVTRKKKLLEKQAKGKKRLQAIGRVSVPSNAIMEVIKQS
mmetsp:Transcript_787/g.1472  ORF Transcript_787/g.1472 Transcript_787/m.1472 type:complete len:677 (+) Transcript_787:53-2083(+)